MAQSHVIRKVLKSAVEQQYPYVIVLSGIHGIGKTQTVKDIAAETKREYHYLRPGSKSDECELTGIPRFNAETNKFEKVPPYWLKRACEVPCIVFIDELNRTTDSMLDIVMQLGDSRSIDTFVLHPETTVFAAINPVATSKGKQYFVNEGDAAFLDRFVVLKFENSIDNALNFYNGNMENLVSEEHQAWAREQVELLIVGADKVAITDDPRLPEKEWTLRGQTQLVRSAGLIKAVPEIEMEIVRATLGTQGHAVYANREVLRSVPTAEEFYKEPSKYDVASFDMVRSHILASRIVNSVFARKSPPTKEMKSGINHLILNMTDAALTVLTRMLRNSNGGSNSGGMFMQCIDTSNKAVNDRFTKVFTKVMEAQKALK